MTFCLTDGADQWDNNGGQNYSLETPGAYIVDGGTLREADVESVAPVVGFVSPGTSAAMHAYPIWTSHALVPDVHTVASPPLPM